MIKDNNRMMYLVLGLTLVFTLFLIVSDFTLAVVVDLNDNVNAESILLREDKVLFENNNFARINHELNDYRERYAESNNVDVGFFDRALGWFEDLFVAEETPVQNNITVVSELIMYGCYFDEPHCNEDGCTYTQRLINCPEVINIEVPENQVVYE